MCTFLSLDPREKWQAFKSLHVHHCVICCHEYLWLCPPSSLHVFNRLQPDSVGSSETVVILLEFCKDWVCLWNLYSDNHICNILVLVLFFNVACYLVSVRNNTTSAAKMHTRVFDDTGCERIYSQPPAGPPPWGWKTSLFFIKQVFDNSRCLCSVTPRASCHPVFFLLYVIT